MFGCMSVCLCPTCVRIDLKGNIKSSGTVELPNMGAGYGTWVPCKTNKCSFLQSISPAPNDAISCTNYYNVF